MVATETELEKIAKAIASCMPCRLCPHPCNSKEHSGMANCVIQWENIMREAVLNSKT